MNKSRYFDIYEKARNKFVEEFKVNKLSVPKVTAVYVSAGLGNRNVDKNITDLTKITGQKVLKMKAKRSVAAFSLLEGQDNGAKVTLRRNNMWNFIDKLLNVALVNDLAFKGFKSTMINNMKKNISFSFGIRDKRIFPEIVEESLRAEGFNITVCTNGRDVKDVHYILKEIGFPILKMKEEKSE